MRELTLMIERPVAGGRMLARHDGQVVLVAGGIPGERVRVRLEPSSRKVLFATVVDVLEASPDRREPICDPACGGMAYAFIAPERQRVLKGEIVADAFRRLARMPLDTPVEVAASPEHGFRLRGRLHVRDGRAGLFLERSHRLCDARATGQFSDGTMTAVEAVLEQMGELREQLASVLVAENVRTTARVLHLEAGDGQRLRADALGMRPLLVDGVTGITTEVNGRMVVVAGVGRVTDTAAELCGEGVLPADAAWTRSAASFFQENRFLTGRLVERVLAHAEGRRVLDLYAGVGLFSVALAARGAEVVAVEGDATSAADLAVNAGRWPTLATQQQTVEAALLIALPGTFDVVVIDPPRTGASPEAMARLVDLGAPRVVYVSCDPATLARDAGRLVNAGYRLSRIEAFDMFPNTPHVETLAIFDR